MNTDKNFDTVRAALLDKVADLPNTSGVYKMYDAYGEILYIGKAKDIKKRVRQYFSANYVNTNSKTLLLQRLFDISIILTNTEIDALILEANLIKKHKPHFNVLMKDDKSYAYIKIDLDTDYPTLSVVRKISKGEYYKTKTSSKNKKYFGPFVKGTGMSVRAMLDLITSAYPIKVCNLRLVTTPDGEVKPKGSHRACLNYHIKKCSAPCVNKITKAQYRKLLDQVIDFLKGNDVSLERVLKSRMLELASREEFEIALEYKKQLTVLEKLKERKITALGREIDIDTFSFYTDGFSSVISRSIIRAGQMLDVQNFLVNAIDSGAEALRSFIAQHYTEILVPPSEIVFSHEMADTTLREYLKNKYDVAVTFTFAKKGIKKDLVKMALKNAKEFLEKSKGESQRRELLTFGAISQLREYLGLKQTPTRIECYDISNITGTDSVASKVVFLNGEPLKSHYRKFKIKTVEGADDYASIKEVITRRLNRLGVRDSAVESESLGDESFGSVPQLIVIDGGKGQLSAALEAYSRFVSGGLVSGGSNTSQQGEQEANQSGEQEVEATQPQLLPKIEFISLAKKNEIVYNVNGEVAIPKDSYALKLLQRLRDEAHRFALGYHRKLRDKRLIPAKTKLAKKSNNKK
ncbi:MAG: excinuclease ABC subunit UvrC [Firmicutes bacterium]|nr:excinuclease ABC subunit UvrC [Bacillota bacterium]